MSTSIHLREALEGALVDNPDDVPTHMAYADLLTEQGDPRGEFISVQLALEDPGRNPEERKQLQRRERELLDTHEREWLGELAPLLLGSWEELRPRFAADFRSRDTSLAHLSDDQVLMGQGFPFSHGWRRGWLDRFECSFLTAEMASELSRAPVACLLRTLIDRDILWNSEFLAIQALTQSPVIRNVRVVQIGQEVDPEEDRYEEGTQIPPLVRLIECMPRLEELSIYGHSHMDDEMWQDMHAILSLPTLTNLRIFRVYHSLIYPLEILAANSALSRLTHLLCFPHQFAGAYDLESNRFTGTEINRENVLALVTSPHLTSLTHLQLRCCSGGDGTIEDIVSSGILKRLKTLDLRHGHVTDAGAHLLATCPDSRNLEVLDLINNRLTTQGIAELQAAGIPVRTDRQQEPPFDDDRILYYGDSE